MERHFRSLEALGQDVSSPVFVSMILSKLPKEVLIQLEIGKPHHDKWTVHVLRDELCHYITAREAAERQSGTGSCDTSPILRQPSIETGQSDLGNTRESTQQTSKLHNRSTAEALLAGSREQYGKITKDCVYCNGQHWSDECSVFSTIEARKEKIKGRCYICLARGHKVRECPCDKLCYYCSQKKNHHRSLCPQKFSPKTETTTLAQDSPTATGSLMASEEMVLMQTASAVVQNTNKQYSENIRILLDSGSYQSYITYDLAKKLKLDLGDEQEISLVTFGNDKPVTMRTPTATVVIPLKDGTCLKMTVNVVPKITGGIERLPMNTDIFETHLLKDFELADTIPAQQENINIDMLLGNDYYLDVIEPFRVHLKSGLYLLGSKLGWILTGRTQIVPQSSTETATPALLLLTFAQSSTPECRFFTSPDCDLPVKPCLEEFWSLETIGIKDSPLDSDDDVARQTFLETLDFNDGRYWVTWPWKKSGFDLPENYELAAGRLKSLFHKLRKMPELLDKYEDIIQDQMKKGVVEKVDENSGDGKKHYIPHHPVITPKKTTTKIRIVYDASAKTRSENPSLNECLYRGPVILENLCGMILRFRLRKVAIIADIEKAFLQVGLQDTERDVTRFLWLKDPKKLTLDGNIQVYRFCRVPFGVISSPFMLAGTIIHLLENTESQFSDLIKQSMYVDNVITGVDNSEQAKEFYKESKVVFQKASMNLREWSSNSKEFLNAIPDIDKVGEFVTKVLGLVWNTQKDTLSTARIENSLTSSKREALHALSQVFDPLGFFAPVMLLAKLFVQELWVKGLDWDEKLSSNLQNQWSEIWPELLKVQTLNIPRYIGGGEGDNTKYELLCFTDASKKAYAAAVYLLVHAETTEVNLIFSKARLAPKKGMSIPRMELLGVLIGVRCLTFVQDQLKLPLGKITLWTDSQCVLKWLTSKKSLSVFVKNRIQEIKSHDINFRYITTNDNPADIATRGIKADCLQENSLWWNGPDWLKTSDWPTWNIEEISRDVLDQIESETKTSTLYEAGLVMHQIPNVAPLGIEDSKYSSITKLIRVTSWCMRFIRKLRKEKTEFGPLTAEELMESSIMWETFVQARGFPEAIEAIKENRKCNLVQQLGLEFYDRGRLRCRGRLANADISDSSKRPILLPNDDNFTNLVIANEHKKLLHSGVSHTLANMRDTYWVPQGRAAVGRVLRRCQVCRRWEGGPYKMPRMPQLPKERVCQSRPFTHTGIDYIGPLYIKENNGNSKVWVCLFTCFVVRAVHLELVRDMSAEQFLLCLRRFIAQRGAPSEITSDNASHFKLAKTTIEKAWNQAHCATEVQTYISNLGIHWKFITELSPWMGGFYERLVGLVKRALRKSLGSLTLHFDQLQTLIYEISAVLNSRPLVYVSEDINSNFSLTPGHFLTLNPFSGTPWFGEEHSDDQEYFQKASSSDKLLEKWKKGSKHIDRFWSIWRTEYLLSLRERFQTQLTSPKTQSPHQPNEGDIVLVHDDLPRGTWKTGRIKELVKSRDGELRTAVIRLPSKKTINRPLKLLYPIECSGVKESLYDGEKRDSTLLNDQDDREKVEPRPKRRAAVKAREWFQKTL